MRLALTGNPTILLPLFVPDAEIVRITELGRELRANAGRVVSRQGAWARGRSASGCSKVNRPELIAKYGFDTKYAMHMVRLGVQGVELLETGRMTLPIAEPWLTWLRDLRRRKHTQDEAIAAAAELEDRLDRLVRGESPLPEEPDREWANRWLVRAYDSGWRA
jgi:hypothetical protein